MSSGNTSEDTVDGQERVLNDCTEEATLSSNDTDNSSNTDGSNDKEKHSTPTKQFFASKRRLAAQFNRPIESWTENEEPGGNER